MKTLFAKMKNMHWNAVFAKESKLRVRNSKFALTVLFYNLLLISVATLGFVMAFSVSLHESINYSNAIGLYVAMIIIEAIVVMFLVPAYTAGSIAGEREKQTLEILLTTTLKPKQIVWGKLMSSISMVLLLIVSTLPTISIIFTIGGVSMWDLLSFVLVVFVFTVLIGSIGVWASVMVKSTVRATVTTYAGIALLCVLSEAFIGIVYIVKMIIYASLHSRQVRSYTPDVSLFLILLLINPACTMIELLTNQFANESFMEQMMSEVGQYWPGFIVDHWVLLSLIAQMALAIFMMHSAAKHLDPLRKQNMSKRKLKKLEKKEQKRLQKIAKAQANSGRPPQVPPRV